MKLFIENAFAANLRAHAHAAPDLSPGDRVTCSSEDYYNETGTVVAITSNMLGTPIVDVALDSHAEINRFLTETTEPLEDWEKHPIGPSCFYATEVTRLGETVGA